MLLVGYYVGRPTSQNPATPIQEVFTKQTFGELSLTRHHQQLADQNSWKKSRKRSV